MVNINKSLEEEDNNTLKIKFIPWKWINTFAQKVIDQSEETGKSVIGIMNNIEVTVEPWKGETVQSFINNYRNISQKNRYKSNNKLISKTENKKEDLKVFFFMIFLNWSKTFFKSIDITIICKMFLPIMSWFHFFSMFYWTPVFFSSSSYLYSKWK